MGIGFVSLLEERGSDQGPLFAVSNGLWIFCGNGSKKASRRWVNRRLLTMKR